MSDLADFARQLEEQLTTAKREPHWKPDEAERHMTAESVVGQTTGGSGC